METHEPLKRAKTNERRRSGRSKSRHKRSQSLSERVPEESMSIDSVPSEDTLSPPRALLRSSSGNHTESRERLSYSRYKDGLLHQNVTLFRDVNFCFKCNTKTLPVTKSIEKTGYKLDNSVQIPVYRAVFLCETCIAELNQAKEASSSNTTTLPVVRLTEEALAYFHSSPK